MNETIKTAEQRPEHPDFWSKRFAEGITPWDAGKVPAAFANFIARQPAPLNTLIPGCGSGENCADDIRQELRLTQTLLHPSYTLQPYNLLHTKCHRSPDAPR